MKCDIILIVVHEDGIKCALDFRLQHLYFSIEYYNYVGYPHSRINQLFFFIFFVKCKYIFLLISIPEQFTVTTALESGIFNA